MRRMPSRQGVAVLVLVVLVGPAALGAQLMTRRAPMTAPRFEAGGNIEYAQPVSQFRQNVKQGYGLAGHFMIGLDPLSVLSLRLDGGYTNYGTQNQYYGSNSAFTRSALRQTTSNNVFVGSVGPQLTVPVGPVRPYVNGGVGFGYFYTNTNLSAYDSYRGTYTTFGQRTNYSDNSLAYTGGAGVYIPLGSMLLDLGARYNAIGKTRYLTRDDITDDPNNPYGVIITPHESEARFVTYRAGLAFRF